MNKHLAFDQLVSLYLDNEITAEQFELLSQQIAGDDGLRRRFIKLSALDFAIAHNTDHRDRQNIIETVLGQTEQETEEDSIFELYMTVQTGLDKPTEPTLNMRDALSLTGYAARLALRDQRVIKFLVAASLVLAAAIVLSLIGPWESSDTAEIATYNSPQADGSAEPAAMLPASWVVATLTAERDTVWDRRPGTDLYAGQRFTLTQGFAEIKTERGAVAIIQAPATIELLDSDNAIRLHAGKLVGICETESSKGFTVHTTHTEVTDLGTRFGVAIDEAGNMLAEVFTGSVVVVPGQQASSPVGTQTLANGEVFAIDSAGQPIQPEVFGPHTFAQLTQSEFALQYAVDGIASLSGNIRRLTDAGSIAKSGHLPTSSEHAWVYSELTGHRLATQIPLTLQTVGDHRTFDRSPTSPLAAAGTLIRSYIIYFSPDGVRDNVTLLNLKGSVVFDGEIIGVIADEVHDQQFAKTVGPDQPRIVRYRNEGSGPEDATQTKANDLVTISPDRRTIHFDFTAAAGGALDMIRVIVQ